MSANKISKMNINLRFNIVVFCIYIIGIIFIITLFNLQIVNGEEYRHESNTRLTRETTLKAARGTIYDSSGQALISTSSQYSLELYKTNMEEEELNNAILNIINVLEKHKIKYKDSFPVKIEPFEFTISGQVLENWKSQNKLNSDISAEQAFYEFKDKYDISNENIKDIRKIISQRYEISIQGYSSIKSLQIAENLSTEAVAELSENTGEFGGINIYAKPIRQYTSGELASHILGYASKISSEEYEQKKDTYKQNDIIGKTGIEYAFEEYLKGKDGIDISSFDFK